MFFGSNVIGEIIESESVRGLGRHRRWYDDRLPWDSAGVQSCIDRMNDPASRRNAHDELILRLLSILPKHVNDALDVLGFDRRASKRGGLVEDVISQAVWHAQRNLRSIVRDKTPGQLWDYYRLRCKSLVRETLDKAPVRAGKRGREPLSDYPSYRDARYAEASQLMTGVALRLAPAGLMELLSDLLRGERLKKAVRLEVERRKNDPTYPASDDARRAGIWRELGVLGALTLAASPDWCVVLWADAWPSELVNAAA
jgi:hypothetical protein